MAKRLYHSKDKSIYRFSEGGNWYCKMSGVDRCLNTADDKLAIKHKEHLRSGIDFFGAAAFSKRNEDLVPIYLLERKKEVRKGHLRESTFSESEKIWKSLLSFFGKKKLIDINQTLWDQYCASSKKKDFQNDRAAMSHYLNWCVSKEYLLAARKLKNPKHRRRRQKIIPPEHLVLIFQWANGGLRTFLTIALFMGMRRSEIIKLTWQRVDFKRRCILLTSDDTKTREAREVPFNEHVARALTAQLDSTEVNSSFVFPNAADPKRHMDPSGFKTAWKTVLKKANLLDMEYHWHNFRATFEKHMHMTRDFSETQLEKMVGAKIDVQRDRYVSMTADDLRGLENVVQIPEVTKLLESGGKQVGKDSEIIQQETTTSGNNDDIN